MSLTDAHTRFFRIFTNSVLLLVSVIVSLALAEIAIRVVHTYFYGYGSRYYYPIVSDDKLGWRAVENYDFKTMKQDAAGTPYEVHLTTDSRGFRFFGDLNSGRPRLFIIGDSFTHAVDASRDDTYYGVLQRILPVEVFAYGGGGYGTFQESMILDKYIDLIKPDAVIIQFSSNDFANNSVEFERRSSDNNSRIRPYLMPDGSIRYAYPARYPFTTFFSKIRTWLSSHLRIMNEIFRAFDKLEPRFLSLVGFKYIDPEIVATDGAVPEFLAATTTTEQIFKRITSRANRAKVFTFSADDPTPYYRAYLEAAQVAGMTVISTVPLSIRAEEQRGFCLRAMDGSHWSPAGHRVVADALASYFKQEGLYVRSR